MPGALGVGSCVSSEDGAGVEDDVGSFEVACKSGAGVVDVFGGDGATACTGTPFNTGVGSVASEGGGAGGMDVRRDAVALVL